MYDDIWISKYRPSTDWEGQKNKKQCMIWFFLFTSSLRRWWRWHQSDLPSLTKWSRHSCHSMENIIFRDWIWIFSQNEYSHNLSNADRLDITPYFSCPTIKFWQHQFFVSFFWCLEKLWCCVCVRTWWDIWGTQCHFMGGGSGESTDFLSGSFSVFCNNWLTNLEHNLKREWYGRYFPNGEFNRPLNPNWEIHL